MLFQRVVIDIEIAPDGRLEPRPGAAWRPEPARGEVSIHRQLSALAELSEVRIAEFASVHGLLRRAVALALAVPAPVSAAATLAIGQERVDDLERVREWFELGAAGDPPPDTSDVAIEVGLYADLSDSVLAAFDALIDGASVPPSTAPSAFYGAVVTEVAKARRAIAQHAADPGRLRGLDPTKVHRALRIHEWVHRVVGGLDVAPGPLAALGGPDAMLRQLLTTIPELLAAPELHSGPDAQVAEYVSGLASETISDWRQAARDLGVRVRALDLIRAALHPDGIGAADKRELATLYAHLADYRSTVDLSAADIADRVRPLVVASIQSELLALGAWPIRRDALAGSYVRALVAAWTEVAESPPSIACATIGCLGVAPPTRNRRYCDACQVTRRRDDVRRVRSRTAKDA